jgi:hypothetical protein
MYTHKPTTLGDTRSKFERTVYCDGVVVGRIHQITYGPPKGKWWWALEWMTDKNSGLVDTKEDALGIIKARHQNAN